MSGSEDDSEYSEQDNFKGVYQDYDWDKYTCPETGAHFNFKLCCKVLSKLQKQRGDPVCE